jgi:hypothetical protein
MLQFNNNHIFTGYLKQFLSSFNLPTCRVYTAEFEKYYAEHGKEDPRVIESNAAIRLSNVDASKIRPAAGVAYLKDGSIQQYFWDTSNWNARLDYTENKITKYWKSNQTLHYNGNKILGLTKTLKNPTTLYNYQTHEYLGDYLRFLRDYENINLMSMYNCFSNRLCNNIKVNLEWEEELIIKDQEVKVEKAKEKAIKTVNVNAYDTNYKIYMLPVKLFEKYTIAIDCYQGVELFCGFYNEKLSAGVNSKEEDLIKKTYVKIPKSLFNQPFVYDKLDVKYWNWIDENSVTRTIADKTASGRKANAKIIKSTTYNDTKIIRSDVAVREKELKLFIKVPATNTSSIVVLEGDYRNFNDSLYTFNRTNGWQYKANSTVANFETNNTYINSTLPDINSREFKPISKLQLLALNTGISYPFADRLMEYLIANVIVPNDPTPDNIKRLQKVMEDCGYSFQIEGIWEPKMQMILYDYLMNSGKFVMTEVLEEDGKPKLDKYGQPIYRVKDKRNDKPELAGNLRQIGQKMRSEFYDILGYGDKDAEKLYASWTVETIKRNGKEKQQVVAKNTLENVDIYKNLYNN